MHLRGRVTADVKHSAASYAAGRSSRHDRVLRLQPAKAPCCARHQQKATDQYKGPTTTPGLPNEFSRRMPTLHGHILTSYMWADWAVQGVSRALRMRQPETHWAGS